MARGSARWAVVLKPRRRFGANVALRELPTPNPVTLSLTTQPFTMTDARRLAVAVDGMPLVFSRERRLSNLGKNDYHADLHVVTVATQHSLALDQQAGRALTRGAKNSTERAT